MGGEPGAMDPDPAAHALVLPFDTEDAEFARGFEAGCLWAELRETTDRIEAIVHGSNTEMILRMAEALDRAAVGEPLDGTWTRVTFEETGSAAGSSP